MTQIPQLTPPPFAAEEYERRRRAVRDRMQTHGVECLLLHTFPDICYLTGFETLAPHKYFALALPPEGTPVLVSQDFEAHNAALGTYDMECAPHPLDADYLAATRDVVADRGWARATLGIDYASTGLRAADFRRLLGILPEAQWVDANGWVESVRTVKSPAELDCIREAARWTSLGMEAAIDAVAEGRTDNDIAAAACHAMIRAGSEYMCYAPIVTTGRRSGIPHSTHRRIRIERGDPVFIELGACRHRYSAPLMRTACVGKPQDAVRQLAEAARNSVETLIANMRPGAVAGEVAQKAAMQLRGIPNSVVWHGYYGYSVGLGFPPEWNDGPVLIREGSQMILEAGMVFHCSTSLREVGRYGATVSETVAVTPSGCEVLTSAPRELQVR
jgi:Xaa-Pro aminopeptidase